VHPVEANSIWQAGDAREGRAGKLRRTQGTHREGAEITGERVKEVRVDARLDGISRVLVADQHELGGQSSSASESGWTEGPVVETDPRIKSPPSARAAIENTRPTARFDELAACVFDQLVVGRRRASRIRTDRRLTAVLSRESGVGGAPHLG